MKTPSFFNFFLTTLPLLLPPFSLTECVIVPYLCYFTYWPDGPALVEPWNLTARSTFLCFMKPEAGLTLLFDNLFIYFINAMLFKNYSLAEVKYFWEDLENSTHLPTTNYEDTVVSFLAHFFGNPSGLTLSNPTSNMCTIPLPQRFSLVFAKFNISVWCPQGGNCEVNLISRSPNHWKMHF